MRHHDPLRDAAYGELARVGQALASPQRLRLLNLLLQGERTTTSLAEALGESLAATSAHLKVLRQAHLIETRKSGRRVLCRVTDPLVARLLVALREATSARVPALRELLRDLETDEYPVMPLDGPTLLAKARKGAVVVLDVRPPDEHAAGHIPGARSIPYPELARRLDELPRDLPVVAYCRGPFCAIARAASSLLAREGFDVLRLDAGMAEWLAADLPVEAAPAA